MLSVKKPLSILSVAMLIVFVLAGAVLPVNEIKADPGTIVVDKNDGSCVSGTGQADPYNVVYCNITDAITDASPGDTIIIMPGTYG